MAISAPVGAAYDAASEASGAVFSAVSRAADQSPNERAFQNACTRIFAGFAERVGVEITAREEYILARGRADAVYNRLVIEYEAPKSLGIGVTSRRTAHAVQQAKDYIDGIVARERHDIDRMLGVVLDGKVVVFVRWVEGTWNVELAAWSIASAERLLRALVSLSSGRALIPDNLVQDFGFEGEICRRATAALYKALARPDPLVDALFEQWKLLFSEVSGFEALQVRKASEHSLATFAAAVGVTKSIDSPRFLFAIHTYFCVLVKSIARLVLERYGSGSLTATPLVALGDMGAEELRDQLELLESGGVYRQLGILNLLEADFFAWYLHNWSTDVAESFSRILSKLSDYNPATLEEDPFAARDLLKKLYHYLMPKELRHQLGEYYTPDWLATRVLNQIGDSPFSVPDRDGRPRLGARILDPACGSGTFPILAIRALKENARRQRLSDAETLDLVLSSVVGIDLNPLAVLSARVGYLLAIADLLPARRGPIVIPIYLADSILMPTGVGLFRGTVALDTVVGRLPVPSTINTSQRANLLTEALEKAVRASSAFSTFLNTVRDPLQIMEGGDDELLLQELYQRLQTLHTEQRDGIWARILSNALMPLFIGEFDYVVGNPPWIGWESVPTRYRQQTAPLWDEYALLPGADGQRPRRARLGAVKVDMSVLMTYVVADRLLKSGGKLAFLITQSVFKTAAGAGFRRFRLPNTPLRVLHVDDMTELQPFEGASNRTSAILLEKGQPTRFPLPYTYWKKTARGRGLGYDSTLPQVEAMTARLRFDAEPIALDDPTSHWLTARPLAIKAIRRMLGNSDYVAHAGVCTWANGIYWLEVLGRESNGLLRVRNAVERGYRNIPQVETRIEPDLIFPLLRAGDIGRWNASPQLHHLVPHDPQNPKEPYPADRLARDFPLTFDYLKTFEAQLRQRSGYKLLLEPRHKPFYTVIDIDRYTFAPYKVVWPNMGSDITAAVVRGDVVPQHTVTLVAAESEPEAMFLCGVANSRLFRFVVMAYSQTGGKSFGSPHVLENVRVPRFSPAEPAHTRVSRIAAKATPGGASAGTEDELDESVAELWSLAAEEWKEVVKGLLELRRGARPGP